MASSGITGNDFVIGNARLVEINAAFLDFAGGKVAVLHRLGHVIFVDRLAEIGDVVRGDFGVSLAFGGFLFALKLARGGGEADLHSVAVAGEGPATTCPRPSGGIRR